MPRLPRVALRQKYGKIALTEQEVNTDLQDLDYTVRVHFAFQYIRLEKTLFAIFFWPTTLYTYNTII